MIIKSLNAMKHKLELNNLNNQISSL